MKRRAQGINKPLVAALERRYERTEDFTRTLNRLLAHAGSDVRIKDGTVAHWKSGRSIPRHAIVRKIIRELLGEDVFPIPFSQKPQERS